MGGQITRALNGLYMGSHLNAIVEEQLLQHGITCVLSVQSENSDLNIHLLIKEDDLNSLFKAVSESNDIIHEARCSKGNILVCSQSGNNSNICLIIIYILSIYKSLDKTSVLTYVNHLMENASIDHDIVRIINSFDTEERLEQEQLRLSKKFADSFDSFEEDLEAIQQLLGNINQEDFIQTLNAMDKSTLSSKPQKAVKPKETQKETKQDDVFLFDQDDILEAIELEVNDELSAENISEHSTEDLVSDVESKIEDESAIEIPIGRGREKSTSQSFFMSKASFDPQKFSKYNPKVVQESSQNISKLSTTVPAKQLFIA